MFRSISLLMLIIVIAAMINSSAAAADLPAAGSDAEKPPVPVRVTDFADTVFVVPKIIVEASRVRSDEALTNRSGFVALIDLSDRRHRVEDLPLLLSQMVGVRVKQYGGLGSYATVSIRGSSSNQVQVYLDGIPMNDAYMGMTNLSDLPLGSVERIEVYRGFTPPHLGSSGIGGSVNLVTHNASRWHNNPRRSHFELHESIGSLGTSRHQLSAWSQLGRFKLFFHGGYITSDGDFLFIDDLGTPQNIEDDYETTRINNNLNSLNLLGRVHLDLPRLGTLSVSHNLLLRDQGVPGLGTHQSEVANSKRDRFFTTVCLEPHTFLPDRLHLSLSGFHSSTRDRFSDPTGQISISKQDTDNTITTYGGIGRAKWFTPLLPAALEVFLEGRKERFHPESQFPTPTSGPDRLRNTRTVSLAAELYLFNQNLILSAGERFERHTNEFYDVPLFPWLTPTPQGKINRREQTSQFGFRWHPISFATIKGNWGNYYRLPTFLELFGNLGSVTGRADLEPEEGLNRDIGVILHAEQLGRFREIFFEAVYLDNEADNLILFFPNSQHTSKPTNIGSATIKGLELSLSGLVMEQFHLSGNYTLLHTEDTSDIPYYNGNQLASRPRHEAAFSIGFIRGKMNITYELHYIGANFLDRANFNEVPARNIHSLVLKLNTPLKGLSFTAEGRNLSDNRISDLGGFPLPGRVFYSTLSYKR